MYRETVTKFKLNLNLKSKIRSSKSTESEGTRMATPPTDSMDGPRVARPVHPVSGIGLGRCPRAFLLVGAKPITVRALGFGLTATTNVPCGRRMETSMPGHTFASGSSYGTGGRGMMTWLINHC